MKATPTTYQLHIRLARAKTIVIGKLGRFRFAAGHYIYTGSAKRNLEARVRRHRSKHKTLYWHIDYLLADPAAKVVQVRLFTAKECALHQQTVGQTVVPGFGAGDCQCGCGSHLRFVG